jgi:L-threonylcarbamoyladenylate synthase
LEEPGRWVSRDLKLALMQVRAIDPTNIDEGAIAEAAAIIRNGGLVAFPTETVYGLGADATNADAVKGIFAAKDRPSYNPLIVHVQDGDAARAIVTEWPETARNLTTRFWPGPLTIVLPKRETIPGIVTAGLPTVGVRVPAHPVALALLRKAGRPIAAPSANQSMRLSPTDGRHVLTSLSDRVGLVLDAGPATVGIESTVLDLSSSVPTILRPGMISRADIAAVIGEVWSPSMDHAAGAVRPSPGMLDRHYSPVARLIVTPTSGARALSEAVAHATSTYRRVAVITTSHFTSPSAEVIPLPDAPESYARALYATLHRLDDERFDVVIVERVPSDERWDGIRDRLTRAAASGGNG